MKIPKPSPIQVVLKSADDDLQVVWGEVYIPDVPDTDGDFMTADEIRKMAWDFMHRSDLHAVDYVHDNERVQGAYVVESFIARQGDPDFAPGAWVVGMKVENDEVWTAIKSQEINGFSMQSAVVRTPADIELLVPDEMRVRTLKGVDVDHVHPIILRFDDEGGVEGEALPDPQNGVEHGHQIKRASVTESTNGHRHRFSFMEELLALQSQLED